jgi:hypothetical protein
LLPIETVLGFCIFIIITHQVVSLLFDRVNADDEAAAIAAATATASASAAGGGSDSASAAAASIASDIQARWSDARAIITPARAHISIIMHFHRSQQIIRV